MWRIIHFLLFGRDTKSKVNTCAGTSQYEQIAYVVRNGNEFYGGQGKPVRTGVFYNEPCKNTADPVCVSGMCYEHHKANKCSCN